MINVTQNYNILTNEGKFLDKFAKRTQTTSPVMFLLRAWKNATPAGLSCNFVFATSTKMSTKFDSFQNLIYNRHFTRKPAYIYVAGL
jgi:hypothetical protein